MKLAPGRVKRPGAAPVSRSRNPDTPSVSTSSAAYGPVIVARYEPGEGSQTTYDADMERLFGPDGSVPRLVGDGLFAFSFGDDAQMNASAATYRLVENAVTRSGEPW